jgi:hypothetical protein
MILISIVGDFHSSIFPIFYEFRESITKHIIVHDDAFGELTRSKKIITALEGFEQKYSLNIDTKDYKLNEDSHESILALVEYIKSIGNQEDVYINTTDGLSNIGVILGSRLLDHGVRLISYDMYENNYNLTSKSDMVTKTLNSKMSINDHFLLKGFEVESFEDTKFVLKNEHHIKKLFGNYSKQFKIMKRDITKSINTNQNQYTQALQLINLMDLNLDTQKKEITGGLFELYIYLLIKDLDFDDIQVGTIIKNKFSKSAAIRNEFDLLIMKDNHLHMIECKFTKRLDMQALVYKYSSLINLIDDDGRMIILTDQNAYSHNDIYSSSENALDHHRRALSNKILIRGSVLDNKDQFIDEVKSYFNI